MSIKVYNTLTRKKEDFIPIDPKNIRIYFCGPTVYSYAHIGNGRAALVFNQLATLMKYVYGKRQVTYVSNITDIDDKIMAAAAAENVPIEDITDKYMKIYNNDMAALGIDTPDEQPRATEYITQMLLMIEKLIRKGHAYEAEDHVLFHVPSFKNYGGLSRRNRDDMIAGARVEVAPYKKDPADFVLWKPSRDDQPGWKSPWGRGRPGWHLECSAMNAAINGETFDIHAGGEDLIFPHHENEIAQSTCAHDGALYAKYWMHNGWLMVEGKKMSKSVGNVLLVHDLVQEYPPEALRMTLLSAHYRQPFDFTKDAVVQAKNTLDHYYQILKDNEDIDTLPMDPPRTILDALKDDLNTPQALSALAAAAKRLSTAPDNDKEQAKGELLAAGELLGLLRLDPAAWFQGGVNDNETKEIEKQIIALKEARAQKDYDEADRIRDILKEKYGVTVSVTKEGIDWRKEA